MTLLFPLLSREKGCLQLNSASSISALYLDWVEFPVTFASFQTLSTCLQLLLKSFPRRRSTSTFLKQLVQETMSVPGSGGIFTIVSRLELKLTWKQRTRRQLPNQRSLEILYRPCKISRKAQNNMHIFRRQLRWPWDICWEYGCCAESWDSSCSVRSAGHYIGYGC